MDMGLLKVLSLSSASVRKNREEKGFPWQSSEQGLQPELGSKGIHILLCDACWL